MARITRDELMSYLINGGANAYIDVGQTESRRITEVIRRVTETPQDRVKRHVKRYRNNFSQAANHFMAMHGVHYNTDNYSLRMYYPTSNLHDVLKEIIQDQNIDEGIKQEALDQFFNPTERARVTKVLYDGIENILGSSLLDWFYAYNDHEAHSRYIEEHHARIRAINERNRNELNLPPVRNTSILTRLKSFINYGPDWYER